MADKSTDQRVKEIIVEQLGVNADQVTPEAKFIEELEADSLDIVELVMALEEEFDIQIPDEAVESNGAKGWADAVTAQRFAEIVAEQLRKKR